MLLVRHRPVDIEFCHLSAGAVLWPRRAETDFAGIVPDGIFQCFSQISRCFRLSPPCPQADDGENVPTSRAVPQAEGWLVRENGPQPGWEILPVSKCRL